MALHTVIMAAGMADTMADSIRHNTAHIRHITAHITAHIRRITATAHIFIITPITGDLGSTSVRITTTKQLSPILNVVGG